MKNIFERKNNQKKKLRKVTSNVQIKAKNEFVHVHAHTSSNSLLVLTLSRALDTLILHIPSLRFFIPPFLFIINMLRLEIGIKKENQENKFRQ